MSQADSAICHSEAEASRPNLKMDTINLKLQLVEGIKKQLVLGEELIAHHLQTRKTKPALISPSIVFKDAIASEKDLSKAIHFLKAISSAGLISPQLHEDRVFLCHFGVSKSSFGVGGARSHKLQFRTIVNFKV